MNTRAETSSPTVQSSPVCDTGAASDSDLKAIKLYRELTGVGLAEAKDAVNRLAAMYRPTG